MPEAWFDEEERSVIVGGVRRHLTRDQWRLLHILWRRLGRAVARDSLFCALYADKINPPADTILSVHVCRIRKALRGSPFTIVTRWGQGFRLTHPGLDNQSSPP